MLKLSKAVIVLALSIASLSVFASTQSRSESMDRLKANEKLIRTYFEEVWNKGHLEVLDQIMAPDYINHSPGIANPKPGPEGLKPVVKAIREGFPDLHYTIEDMVIGEDKVAVRVTMRGTNTGPLFGSPPTGKKVEVGQMQFEWLKDGKISQHWRRTDDASFAKQLGMGK